MIGDPLFYQRLLRLVQARGSTPQAFADILGSVISIDAGLLLERAGRLPVNLFTRTGRVSVAAGGAGQFGNITISVGARSGIVPGRDRRVELLQYSLGTERPARFWLVSTRTIVDGAIFGLDIFKVEAGGTHGEIGAQEQTTTSATDPDTDPAGEDTIHRTDQVRAAVQDYRFEYDGIQAGIPAAVKIFTPERRDYIRFVVNDLNSNEQISVAYQYTLRVFDLP